MYSPGKPENDLLNEVHNALALRDAVKENRKQLQRRGSAFPSAINQFT